nr:MAG TPA: hypothetical protein [Caudoviricetes sp.]
MFRVLLPDHFLMLIHRKLHILFFQNTPYLFKLCPRRRSRTTSKDRPGFFLPLQNQIVIIMETSFCITFYIDQEIAQPDNVRTAFANQLRRLNLRYRSKPYYPESGWLTPAFGVPVELSFYTSIPKGRPSGSKALHQALKNAVNEIEREHKEVVKTAIERACHPSR